MQKNNPLVSICIPTFNRAKYLSEALDSILIAVKGFEDIIEIIISDNKSTDNTQEIIKKYQVRYNYIRFNQNKENVLDKNFFIVASLARGKYIWIFADDDKMEEKAIENVIGFIKKDFNLIISNYSIWNQDFSNIIKEKYYETDKNQEFNNHNEILSKLGNKVQFLSSIIIKKETFFSLQNEEYISLHEYGISFAFALYCGIINHVKAVLICEPQLKYRGNNSPLSQKSTWYKYFAFGSSLLFCELQKKGYSAQAVNKAKNIVLNDYILHDISFRKCNGENLSGLFKMILPFYKNQSFFWLVIVPMLFAPKELIIVGRKVAIWVYKLSSIRFNN